ncbi:lysozyme [Sphingobium limneticum]|uniref:Lysozyme n=1 Tax=Sphingobium limneticum TaxID=1007511 RepID=A0A5J5HR83_9SPHN|nr:lysozyme [Sphingobium limneticum]KAA9010935.1 lysozyme [Sphingobium limneticum]KAA9023022.1 lysozyme [Sphingobium limneticum]
MTRITINGELRTLEDWEKESGVPADTIKERHLLGYSGSILLLSKRDWRLSDDLADAEPADDYEKAIRKMIKAEIPQFRFDIIVELCRDIGLGVFKPSALRRNLSRGNQRSAVLTNTMNEPADGGLLSFYGPKGKPRMSWMKERADQWRRWQTPYEN